MIPKSPLVKESINDPLGYGSAARVGFFQPGPIDRVESLFKSLQLPGKCIQIFKIGIFAAQPSPPQLLKIGGVLIQWIRWIRPPNFPLFPLVFRHIKPFPSSLVFL
jgi:hypothetical protein